MSIQAFGILEKVAEVDGLLSADPHNRTILREVHPELSFFFLNGCRPLVYSKKQIEGREERLCLLRTCFGPSADQAVGRRSEIRCQGDDIIDAMVALWTAERILRGEAVTVPANPPLDVLGIRMEMVA